jgi:protein TonB
METIPLKRPERLGRAIGPRRAPFALRKRSQRHEGRLRVARWVRRPITATQRARDPWTQSRSWRQLLVHGVLTVLGTVTLHGAVLVGGVIGYRHERERPRVPRDVEIHIRERPAPPPEPLQPPPPRPVEPVTRAPRRARAEPPPPPRREPPAPARVVGLSLEATSESGEGPAFAVGNTRQGQTAERAAAPSEVAPVASGSAAEAPLNRVASRIPVTGARYTAPRRRTPSQPQYPATLKSQGVEADVTVMVSLDVRGRVTTMKIIKEAAYPAFNEAARQAALAEEYEAATRDGVPIPYTLSFTYRFRLEDSP